MNIDKRYIFVLIALGVIIPMLLKVMFPIDVTGPTKGVYEYIENLPEGSVIMMAFDYGPASMAELQPMALAVLRHCFSKNLKVIGMALWNVGSPLGKEAFKEVAAEYGRTEGEDYVFLGFRTGGRDVILLMGEGIVKAFDKDTNGTPTEQIPMMKNIKDYDDIDLVVEFGAGNPGPETWIIYAYGKYGQKIASGVTGVIVSQLYPFIQTGQLVGLMPGLLGAAEYETLVGKPGVAVPRMSVQSIVHLIIIALVILGNVAYFITRRRETAM